MVLSGAAPRFTLGRSILFSAILVVGFFGALELLLRVVGVSAPPRPRILLRAIDEDIEFPFMRPDPDLFWRPRPGFQGDFLGQPVAINSWGLRGPEPSRPKPPGRRRLLCFGDSITFGYGVGEGESYPARLGEALASRSAEVVNAGCTGYTSHQVLALLRRLLPQAEADAVSVLIGWNDGTRRPVDDRGYARALGYSSLAEGWLGYSYTYRAMQALFQVRPAPGRAAAVTERVPLPQYRQNLEAVVRECRARKVRPFFVALPHRLKPGEKVFETPYAAALQQAASALDVPLLQVGPLGLTASEPNDQLFVDSLHLSPEGNRLMAGLLADQLASAGF